MGYVKTSSCSSKDVSVVMALLGLDDDVETVEGEVAGGEYHGERVSQMSSGSASFLVGLARESFALMRL